MNIQEAISFLQDNGCKIHHLHPNNKINIINGNRYLLSIKFSSENELYDFFHNQCSHYYDSFDYDDNFILSEKKLINKVRAFKLRCFL